MLVLVNADSREQVVLAIPAASRTSSTTMLTNWRELHGLHHLDTVLAVVAILKERLRQHPITKAHGGSMQCSLGSCNMSRRLVVEDEQADLGTVLEPNVLPEGDNLLGRNHVKLMVIGHLLQSHSATVADTHDKDAANHERGALTFLRETVSAREGPATVASIGPECGLIEAARQQWDQASIQEALHRILTTPRIIARQEFSAGTKEGGEATICLKLHDLLGKFLAIRDGCRVVVLLSERASAVEVQHTRVLKELTDHMLAGSGTAEVLLVGKEQGVCLEAGQQVRVDPFGQVRDAQLTLGVGVEDLGLDLLENDALESREALEKPLAIVLTPAGGWHSALLLKVLHPTKDSARSWAKGGADNLRCLML
jgi:hypothetical protein